MADARRLVEIRYTRDWLSARLPTEIVDIIQDYVAPDNYGAEEFLTKFGSLEESYVEWPEEEHEGATCSHVNGCAGLSMDCDCDPKDCYCHSFVSEANTCTCPVRSSYMWSTAWRQFVRVHCGKICALEDCNFYHSAHPDWSLAKMDLSGSFRLNSAQTPQTINPNAFITSAQDQIIFTDWKT